MTGTASFQVRSAYVAETTPGTTPTTPGFTTLNRPARMAARQMPEFGSSLVGGGARLGHGVNGIDVTGTLETPLIYGVYDPFFETLLQAAWSTNTLKDGKAVKSVTIENTMPAGVGGTSTMLRYRGVEAMSATLSLQARSAAALSMQLAGRGSDAGSTTAISGATYSDPTEFDPLSSGADVGTITMAGYTLDCFQSLNIALNFDGRELQPKLASDDLCGITRGAFMPALTGRVYVEANFMAMYNAARARHSAFKVTVPLGSVTGEKYTLEFHSCFFGPTEIDMSGASLMQTVEIMPQYDTTEDCVLEITRAVS